MRFIVLELREGKDKRKKEKGEEFGFHFKPAPLQLHFTLFTHTFKTRSTLEVSKRGLEIAAKHALGRVTSAEEIALATEPFPLSSLNLISTHALL